MKNIVNYERNKGNNYPLKLNRKRNTETDIKWSLPYGTAPGIECLRAYRDNTKPLFQKLITMNYNML